ncbi:rRNA pseudouridine synthase [Ectopseudomonas guguanensis]|uniref:Dual-specificity RNA pseudouridine synthase RluF n=1 Tax=Ectopseudomonas guguanensis TaxID=1198456 RepID=A0A1H0JR65_9GAMM|nr:rRNA pseudouridine synthase [Pseudomonas guguanensis]SDO45992.1 23S rRNA pseudouridine2604 synthase [Pseudomonas guguanensis]
MSEPTRLSKRVIELFGCSRREADLYITGGWVAVDGQVVEAPQFKVTEQRIELLPGASLEPVEPVTLLLHCPAGASAAQLQHLLVRERHWEDDPHAQRILHGHFLRQEQSLPLQNGASGLVVLSQDWRAQRKLREDGAKLEQEYLVDVAGELAAGALERLKKGLIHKGTQFPPCKASWQSEQRLRFALKNPPAELLQQICKALGLQVKAMKRIRIGGVPMAKLPAGQWRYLGDKERF